MLSLLSALDIGFALADADGQIVFADRTYARILQRPVEQVIGLTISEMTHPDDLPLNVWLFSQAKRGGGGFDLRKRYLLEDGAVQWVENRVSSLSGVGGAPVYVVASRRIAAPPNLDPDDMPRSWPHTAYAADMTSQLARMMAENSPGMGAELLDLAAHALDAEASAAKP